MTDISIRVDDQVVRRALGDAQRQAPFAISLAVNNVTKDAQAKVREGYQQRFTLRKPDFVLKEGAKITRFAKKNTPTAILQVSDKASFLVKFEEGDEKRPKDGSAIAVPLAVRRNKNDIIPASQRPPALYAGRGRQGGRIWSAGGRLWQQVGRGVGAVVKALYVWRPSVRVRPMLQFTKTVNDTVDQQWETRALEAVDKAISTMR